MKQLKHLQRLQTALELVHLTLMTLCLALPLFCIVPEYPDLPQLLWAVGACLPVLAVQLLSRLPKKAAALLSTLAVLALSLLLCRTTLLRVWYGVLIGLQALICYVLPHPEGRTVLLVPKLWHLPAPLLCYAFARVLDNRLLPAAAVGVALLFALNYALYFNTDRLIRTLCDRSAGQQADLTTLRLNRRLMAVLVLIGLALTAAVLLFHRPVPQTQEMPLQSAAGPVQPPEKETETLPPVETAISAPSASLDLSGFTGGATALMYLLVGAAVLLSGLSIVLLLRSIIGSRRKRRSPPQTVSLPPEAAPSPVRRQKERTGEHGWNRRVRRQYARLIRSRSGKTQLSAHTPQELEDAAALPQGDARSRLHTLYEQARYSAQGCDRQDYLAAKSAAQQLRKEEASHA